MVGRVPRLVGLLGWHSWPGPCLPLICLPLLPHLPSALCLSSISLAVRGGACGAAASAAAGSGRSSWQGAPVTAVHGAPAGGGGGCSRALRWGVLQTGHLAATPLSMLAATHLPATLHPGCSCSSLPAVYCPLTWPLQAPAKKPTVAQRIGLQQ